MGSTVYLEPTFDAHTGSRRNQRVVMAVPPAAEATTHTLHGPMNNDGKAWWWAIGIVDVAPTVFAHLGIHMPAAWALDGAPRGLPTAEPLTTKWPRVCGCRAAQFSIPPRACHTPRLLGTRQAHPPVGRSATP